MFSLAEYLSSRERMEHFKELNKTIKCENISLMKYRYLKISYFFKWQTNTEWWRKKTTPTSCKQYAEKYSVTYSFLVRDV